MLQPQKETPQTVKRHWGGGEPWKRKGNGLSTLLGGWMTSTRGFCLAICLAKSQGKINCTLSLISARKKTIERLVIHH